MASSFGTPLPSLIDFAAPLLSSSFVGVHNVSPSTGFCQLLSQSFAHEGQVVRPRNEDFSARPHQEYLPKMLAIEFTLLGLPVLGFSLAMSTLIPACKPVNPRIPSVSKERPCRQLER